MTRINHKVMYGERLNQKQQRSKKIGLEVGAHMFPQETSKEDRTKREDKRKEVE